MKRNKAMKPNKTLPDKNYKTAAGGSEEWGELFPLRLIGPALGLLLATTTATTTTIVFAVFVWLRGYCESRKSSFCLTP